jgi:hypothetical protein
MAEQSVEKAQPRRRLPYIHLRVGDPVKRHDLGDSIARRAGVHTVAVACGKPDVFTTMTTKAVERVTCPGCISNPPERNRADV